MNEVCSCSLSKKRKKKEGKCQLQQDFVLFLKLFFNDTVVKPKTKKSAAQLKACIVTTSLATHAPINKINHSTHSDCCGALCFCCAALCKVAIQFHIFLIEVPLPEWNCCATWRVLGRVRIGDSATATARSRASAYSSPLADVLI